MLYPGPAHAGSPGAGARAQPAAQAPTPTRRPGASTHAHTLAALHTPRSRPGPMLTAPRGRPRLRGAPPNVLRVRVDDVVCGRWRWQLAESTCCKLTTASTLRQHLGGGRHKALVLRGRGGCSRAGLRVCGRAWVLDRGAPASPCHEQRRPRSEHGLPHILPVGGGIPVEQ